MRKIHYNVMRFKETLSVDDAEVLAAFRKQNRIDIYNVLLVTF